MADGIITPPISVTSAVEGLRQLPVFAHIETLTIVGIVVVILSFLFFLQQFGTASIGKLFGPIMFIWFSMLAVMGSIHLLDDVYIFRALSPHYAIDLLTKYPKGFLVTWFCISLHHRCRSFVFRFGALWQRQHTHFMDFCKNMSYTQLSRARRMAAGKL